MTRSGSAAARARSAAVGVAVAVLCLTACGDASPRADDRTSWREDPGAGMPMDGVMGRDGGMGAGTGTGMGMRSESEADFLTVMVAHHEEAVVAAEQLRRSPEPAMRRLGRTIVRGQTAEVEQMQRWLSRWHPSAGPADYDPMMDDLSGLGGSDLDATFLTEMLPHHMAAVMMSRHLLMSGRVEHEAVAGLARSIVRTQTAEIHWMRARLTGR